MTNMICHIKSAGSSWHMWHVSCGSRTFSTPSVMQHSASSNSIQTVMPRSWSRSNPRVWSTQFESEAILTPTTPTDPGEVTDGEEFLSLKFECKVVMPSGKCLGPFKCDEITSVGWIRNELIKAFEDIGLERLEWEGFALMRNEHILNSVTAKVFELREMDKNDCLLTVVFISNASNDGHAVWSNEVKLMMTLLNVYRKLTFAAPGLDNSEGQW